LPTTLIIARDSTADQPGTFLYNDNGSNKDNINIIIVVDYHDHIEPHPRHRPCNQYNVRHTTWQ